MLVNYRLFSAFTNFSPTGLLFWVPESPVVFSCYVFFISAKLGQFFSLSLSLMTWPFWKVLISHRMSFNLGVAADEMEVRYLWQEFHRNDAVFLLVHHFGVQDVAVCLITGEISHDQLVKVLSTSYLHSKVTIFPLYKEYIFGGETLRLCEYLVSPQILPMNFGIYWGVCLQQLLRWCLNGEFWSPSLLVSPLNIDILYLSCLWIYCEVINSYYLNHSFKVHFFQIIIKPLFLTPTTWIYLTDTLLLSPFKLNLHKCDLILFHHPEFIPLLIFRIWLNGVTI